MSATSTLIPAPLTRLRRCLEVAAAQISLWRLRYRSRQELGTLEPRLLRDLGLDRATAAAESDRPFWR